MEKEKMKRIHARSDISYDGPVESDILDGYVG